MRQNRLKIISAKDLGKLNLADFCPRCFWIERHIDKPPALFPGIFSTLDSITKRSTQRSFLQRNRVPGWLPIADAVEVEEEDTYFKLPVEYGKWILTGKPDDIFKTKDGAYHIVDYKTAKFTSRQDELLPLYEVQLNCYGYLAPKYGFEPVTNLSLIYCQPNECLDNDEEFRLSFKTYSIRIDLDLGIVQELLIKAREILEQTLPPSGVSNCKGICQWVGKVIKKVGEGDYATLQGAGEVSKLF